MKPKIQSQESQRQEPQTEYFPLERLPKDLLFQVIAFKYLSLKETSRLAQTSQFFESNIQPELTARKLVQHVVWGEKDTVEKMIKANPELLLKRATVVDYSGRTIRNTTAFEAALGAGDTDMAQMLAPYFEQLTSVNGEEEYRKQYSIQFPEDPEIMLSKMPPYDFSTLVDVISHSSAEDLQAQLDHQVSDSLLCETINQFRNDFKPGNVTTGWHFNHQNLINAFDIYTQQYDRWDDNQQDLFWRQVIGYTQRFLPACDAQAFCQGLHEVVEKNEPLRRSLEFKYEKGVHIFPLVRSF